MTKRNPYLQHTYESFDQPVPPRRSPQPEGLSERIMNSELGLRLRSPLVATAALLVTGAALAGIIAISYPDSKAPDDNLPVITADASPLREAPTEAGGMDIAHDDSTIYGSIRSAELQETAPIENLLAETQPVDTQSAFASADAVASIEPAAGDLEPAPAPQAEAVIADANDAPPPSEMADATATKPEPIEEAGKPEIPDLRVAETRTIPMKSEKIPPAAANSPETLAYMRSVLDKQEAAAEGKTTQTAAADEPKAADLARIEPTAGAATTAGAAIKPGNNFVQLASISSESLAPKEWAKLQKQFPSLGGAKYRVQRADLGAKGIFFRIQAGPMSKDSAKSVCDSIKASKPGGCIIVQ